MTNNEMSFKYSGLFYLAFISDLILFLILFLAGLSGIFTNGSVSDQYATSWYFLVISLVNLILDAMLLRNRMKSFDTINLSICWIKGITGILGILTFLSGLYFIIISAKMQSGKEHEILQKRQEADQARRKIEAEENQKKIQAEEMRKKIEAESRQNFIENQKAKGLVFFTDRNGIEHWDSPEQIEKIKQKEAEDFLKESLAFKVAESIRTFKPTMRWGNENNYHIELLGWLKREFPGIVGYEVQSGSSRPDLSIQDIAIEIKGPTDNQALNTLASKLLRYGLYYNTIIIVLFECNFSDGVFNELKEGIGRHFPNVIIIRK